MKLTILAILVSTLFCLVAEDPRESVVEEREGIAPHRSRGLRDDEKNPLPVNLLMLKTFDLIYLIICFVRSLG